MTSTVLLAGNPNSGKTTLFNRLAGTRARTGNFPGVTVERRTAKVTWAGRELELVDLPGTYSLSARSPEEQIAVDALVEKPDSVIVVADATALARSLYLAVQVLEVGVPVVVALNMMDEARREGIDIDVALLSERLGVPVVELVASKGVGLDALRSAHAELGEVSAKRLSYGDADRFVDAMSEHFDGARARAAWALLSIESDDELDVSSDVRQAALSLRKDAEADDVDLDQAIVQARYAWIDGICADAVKHNETKASLTDRMDDVLVHPVWGTAVFALVMLAIFEALFTWSEPFIGWIETGVGVAQGAVWGAMAEGPLRELLVHGVIAGVGNVVVFVPQIALLFLLITFLEDSGYLARVAFVIDRVMKGVGLHGKAFVPLLSGFACAIPAVMATRTIADRKDRIVTMLALPLMSCSARLPVYVLLTATIFAHDGRVGGIISTGALVLFVMYALSVLATLGAAAVLRRTVLKGARPTLVLELPPYRWPTPQNLLSTTWSRVRSFLVDAGTIILALTIVLWALLSYPKNDDIVDSFVEQRAQVEATLEGDERAEALARLDDEEASRLLEGSIGGQLGKAIEPALEPLGMDWRLGIGVIGAFAAREVFVSTLGIVFGVGDEVDEEDQTLREELRSATWPGGATLLTPLSGLALMIFFVFACQCMSTIAVVKRESGSWKWPAIMFAYMTTLAYVAALAVYQIGSAMGWGT